MTILRNLGETDAHYELRRCAYANRLMARGLPGAAAKVLLSDEEGRPPGETAGPCRVIRWQEPPT